MAVHLIVKVNLDDMQPTVLYPPGGGDEHRIATLTGIIQLVSAALERSDSGSTEQCIPHLMKSERGVIAYCTVEPFLYISEGDTENETADALTAAVRNPNLTEDQLASQVDNVARKRGREIGDLWK